MLRIGRYHLYQYAWRDSNPRHLVPKTNARGNNVANHPTRLRPTAVSVSPCHFRRHNHWCNFTHSKRTMDNCQAPHRTLVLAPGCRVRYTSSTTRKGVRASGNRVRWKPFVFSTVRQPVPVPDRPLRSALAGCQRSCAGFVVAPCVGRALSAVP